MSHQNTKGYGILNICAALCSTILLLHSTNANGLTLNASNIQEMAIYKDSPTLVRYLEPGKIVFNVTSASVISNLISTITFSAEYDCSDVGSLASGIIYIKFKDGNIELYDLFSEWSHISKLGLRGSCYSISDQGRTLFESNAQ
jgi:hypothetical protein